MPSKETRIEQDFLGDREVPADAYYGVQTLRGAENFPITGYRIHPALIRGMGIVKKAAALANRALELLDHPKGYYEIISPNSHVNMAQSTNDAFPTGVHIATLDLGRKLV